ncbi:MAG: peptidylprolyl isomerase [Lentisphaerae bacterium]|nr:peptidylprolyl isomerase [Lentisphaerota bacterium]
MSIRVNGQPIPDSAIRFELDRLVKFYSAHMSAEQLRAQMDTLREKARQQAIGARLLIEESNKLDIFVPPEEVENRLGEMIEHAGGREAFEALLQRQGLTEAQVRRSIEQGRRVDRLVDRITEGVSDPTEEEVRAHFQAHRKEYTRPDRVQAQHILVKPASGSEADRETARSALLEIRHRVEAGADFADEAAAHSECPSGRTTGGSLGWFSRGMMLPAFDRAVFEMENGALSDVVETPLGFHLIHKLDAETGGPADYEDVYDKIRDFLRHVRRGEAIAAHVAELKQKAVIEADG